MCSNYRTSRAWPLIGVLAVLAGCAREERAFTTAPEASTPPTETAMSSLVGGHTDLAFRAQQQRVYESNAYQLSQGQTLYSAFNCVGCHAHGGGDVGPALMDDKWIYGGEIDQIYLSIAQGRPNGMPAFAGRIPPQQMWQIAAFVRSLGGHGPKAARPGRTDHLRVPSPQEAVPSPIVSAAREDG
jgi:cytochrome c oxidase cbb3-type subunit III